VEVWEWGIARGRSENVGFHWVDQQPSGGQIDRRGILGPRGVHSRRRRRHNQEDG